MLSAVTTKCNTTSQYPNLVKSAKPTKHSEGFHVSNNNLFSILTGNEKKLLDFYQSVAYKVERYNAKYTINEIALAVGMSRSTVIRHNRRLELMGYLVVKRAWLDFNRCAINAYTVVNPGIKQPKKLSTASSKLEQLCKVIPSCKNLIPKVNLDTSVNNDPVASDHNLKISEKKEVGKRLNFAYKPKAEAPLEADLSNLIPMYDDPKPKEKAKAVYEAAGEAVTLLVVESEGRGIGDNRKATSLLNKAMQRIGTDNVFGSILTLLSTAKCRLYEDRDTRRMVGLLEQTIKQGRQHDWKDIKDFENLQ